MKTGDTVRISNAYFKNDNGLYFVAYSPEDPTWCGSDYSLRKICNNGKLSTAKSNIAFWPLAIFTNSYEKRIEGNAWNREHATIEAVEGIPTEHILEYFKEEAKQAKESADYYTRMWGEEAEGTQNQIKIADFYDSIVAGLTPAAESETDPDPKYISLEGEATPGQAAVLDMIVEKHEHDRRYYPINEATAKTANDINSFSTYEAGSATADYQKCVDAAYAIADQIAEKKSNYSERAYYMADRYAKKYADYLNAYYRNESSCPSILICGGSNFPVAKKNKQNSRRDTLSNEFRYIQKYFDKLKSLLYNDQPIKSGDADAIERLQDKISDLEQEKEHMKELNAYYRKHNNSLEGYEGDLSAYEERHYKLYVNQGWTAYRSVLFDTTNTNAEINRCRERLEKLQSIKERGTTEESNDLFTVVENTEIMRLQILFDNIPTPEVREVLKRNGFKWSPKNQAWQRQLTDNARYSLKIIEKALCG